VELLRIDELVRTSEVDHADWNYRGLLGVIQRKRFQLLLSLIGKQRFSSLLEIGYGSGVLMPELSRIADSLYGLDVHHEREAVSRVLEDRGVRATLAWGSATEIPFPDSHFGCVTAVSTLEYLDDIALACAEIQRVLEPDGLLVLVTPGDSPLLDIGLRLGTGESARQNYSDRRSRLMPILTREFETEIRRNVRVLGIGPALYTGLRLRKRRSAKEAQ
jgi:ubiquinone/menaquinone biosynthesis C-methylase UbiE